jgi:hypothetical protein
MTAAPYPNSSATEAPKTSAPARACDARFLSPSMTSGTTLAGDRRLQSRSPSVSRRSVALIAQTLVAEAPNRLLRGSDRPRMTGSPILYGVPTPAFRACYV